MPEIEAERAEILERNFQLLREKVRAACLKSGRDDSEVDILAVTKYAIPAEAQHLAQTGLIKAAGESKVQDAQKKWGAGGPLADVRKNLELHFIGHLQSNKAADAVEFFDWIDSVDSAKLAGRISQQAQRSGRKVPILIQLKLTESQAQGGIKPEQARDLLLEIRKMAGICPSGYMAIAPITEDPEILRPLFREVKKMFDRDFPGKVNEYGFLNRLSLGMSQDFSVAVEEGSNLPRIGSLLFQ